MKIIQYLLILPIIFLIISCSNKNLSLKDKIITKNFLPNNSDIPLFFDFVILDEETLNFDSSSGNISHITYKSKSKIDIISKYYENNLKNLGWKKIDESINFISFERDEEKLKISYDLSDNNLIVKFFIIKNG